MSVRSTVYQATRTALYGKRAAWLLASVSCVTVLSFVDARAASDNSQARELEVVIVTAQKQEERLQDVPVPVTTIGALSLVESHQLRLQDYYTQVPGVSLTLLGDEGAPVITIRGVTTGGYTNPTVGVTVDDVPFGPSTLAGFGFSAPDFDPSELARIEVLRGPQGTLYGASSLGGLLKYVTVDPSTEEFTGNMQVGSTSVKNGDGVGHSLRASVNVPLSDTLAIRASGSTRRDPGYIDDPVLGEQGVNQIDSDSGRLSALWRPSDEFSVKLSALMQHIVRGGESTVHVAPGLGDLQHRDLRDSGENDVRLQAYSATVNANIGNVTVTSLTGYNVARNVTDIDATPVTFLSNLTQAQFGVAGVTNPYVAKTYKFSQELRATLPVTDKIDWLVGAFYTRESYPSVSNIRAVDTATGDVAGTWFDASRWGRFTELAAFTDVTFKITDRFDVQVGGRESRIKLSSGGGITTGPWNTLVLGQSSLSVETPQFESTDSAFTYLLTPRFKISDDLMLYARLASGYRPGGPNTSTLARALGLPSEYSPDTTENYEVGFKGDVLDHLLSFDASIYYIDWKDLQLQLRNAATFELYFVNASSAKSRGVELSLTSRPVTGLTVSGWVAWNDAELSDDLPANSPAQGASGDRLPYSGKLSGNLSIDGEFPLATIATGFVGASASYVDDRKGAFQSGPEREIFPSYTQIDLRAGARIESWTVSAFVNNVADKRGVLRSGADSTLGLPFVFNYIQPRTAGVSVTKTF